MYIYSIYPKDISIKEIYIGKTNDLTQRLYAHKCRTNYCLNQIYQWMNKIGWENLQSNVIFEYNDTDDTNYEKIFIEDFNKKGWIVVNQQMNNYHPDSCNKHISQDVKEQIWEEYAHTSISTYDLCTKYMISSSMLQKIITQHGGSIRYGKLYGLYEQIQQELMEGYSQRFLARKYKVCKNSIANINTGITCYNPELSYPLNQYVKNNNVNQHKRTKHA